MIRLMRVLVMRVMMVMMMMRMMLVLVVMAMDLLHVLRLRVLRPLLALPETIRSPLRVIALHRLLHLLARLLRALRLDAVAEADCSYSPFHARLQTSWHVVD